MGAINRLRAFYQGFCQECEDFQKYWYKSVTESIWTKEDTIILVVMLVFVIIYAFILFLLKHVLLP